jgi:hypothetical protein
MAVMIFMTAILFFETPIFKQKIINVLNRLTGPAPIHYLCGNYKPGYRLFARRGGKSGQHRAMYR